MYIYYYNVCMQNDICHPQSNPSEVKMESINRDDGSIIYLYSDADGNMAYITAGMQYVY